MATVLKIRLGALATFDLIRDRDHYIIAFAERGQVQRRTLVHLHPDQARRAGRFLMGQNVISTPPLEEVIEGDEVTNVQNVPMPVEDDDSIEEIVETIVQEPDTDPDGRPKR